MVSTSMHRFSTLFLSMAVLSACALGQSTFSTIKTDLTCGGCVADGIGQVVTQRSCDEGEFDSLCDAGDCSCPFTIRRAQIMCEGDACFDAASLQVRNITFERMFNRAGPYRLLRYEVVATVFDKNELKPGPCDAVVIGETSPMVDDMVVTEEVENAVKKGVEQAIKDLAEGVKVVCDQRIRRVANKALYEALPGKA